MTTLPGLPTIKVKGPFWSAEVDLIGLTVPPTTGSVVLLDETFDRHAAGDDPAHWVDTKEQNSFDEDQSLFKCFSRANQMVYGTKSRAANLHSHYVIPNVLRWTNYVYTGRMLITDSNGGIGVTFFSRFPERENSYYRLRTYWDRPTFHIAPHPHGQRTVDQSKFDSGVTPQANTWYRFHIEVEDTDARTNIRAKVWAEGTPEPAAFQIETFDSSPDRLRSGTVGVWSAHGGEKYFDDLRVRTLGSAAQPLPPVGSALLNENFDAYQPNKDPTGWVDTVADNKFAVDDSIFKTRRINGNVAFGTATTQDNIHSHYHASDVLTWTNYAFSGRMYVDGLSVGVTFFSRFPERKDDYYRLRANKARQTFHIAPHPHGQRTVDQAKFDSGVKPKSKTWYRFYIEVEDDGKRTNIRAKVWQDGTAEPAQFQIETFDDKPDRLRAGTVGVWSDRDGQSYVDDLVVQPLVSTQPALTTLFLDREPRAALGVDKLLAPGTLIALCAPKAVALKPQAKSGPTYQWQRTTPVPLVDTSIDNLRQLLQRGELSLLLLQADPAAWPRRFDTPPEFTCINGEINLDLLTPQSNSTTKLYTALGLGQVELEERPGAAALLGRLTVHSSGATLLGAIQLPWQPVGQRLAAPFQLARLLATRADNQSPFLPSYQLTVEVERLTPTERRAFIAAWRNLSTYINPRNPLHGFGFEDASTTIWTTLEITNPLDVPTIFWQIETWSATPQLYIAPGELTLLLSDRQPYDQNAPPTTLASISPTAATPLLVSGDGNTLQFQLAVGTSDGENTTQISYEADLNAKTEHFHFPALDLAFDPIETPRLLRDTLEAPPPTVLTGAGDTLANEPVLWGFMPLADGWAQLPVPNLTAELYFQAQAESTTEPASEKGGTQDEDETSQPIIAPLLQGAVALGNNYADTLARHAEEQAWNLTITGVQAVNGMWTLIRDDGSQPFRLQEVTLTLSKPTVVANGFFWFGSSRPTAADALPDLANWVAGLVQIPLRSLALLPSAFPPIVQVGFDAVTLSLRNSGEPPSARLDDWSLLYQIVQPALDQLGVVKPIINEALQTLPPLVWRRHPTLPVIQSLPLTQTQSPPNHPSASRQLAPYQFDAEVFAWKFGVKAAADGATSAAAQWPVLQSACEPATEWRTQYDLSMAALSLPGLYFDSHLELPPTGLDAAANAWLPVRYRYDLPYTDELNALAQLPKEPRDPNEVSPLPDSPPPKPAEPLRRQTLMAHWQRLSEQASLAAVSAADALIAHNGQSTIQRLIEPLVWPVAVSLNLTSYPGVIELDNAARQPSLPLQLTTISALEGLSGRFAEVEDGSNTIFRTDAPATAGPFLVRAGSMQSHVNASRLRDQRGLQRELTRRDSGNANLLVTEVTLYGDPTLESEGVHTYHLMSLREPIQLDVPGSTNWHFWCKDLPGEVTGETMEPEFERSHVLSPVLKTLEGETQQGRSIAAINDPEALAREQNYRLGYEWRLGDGATTAGPAAVRPLPLNGLVFFPLTLETVRFASGQIVQLEIVGRLQLPLTKQQTIDDEPELEELSNGIRLVFTAKEPVAPAGDATPTATLVLTDIRLASSVVEWPLRMAAGEQTNAPRLEWCSIRLGAQQEIIIGNAAPGAADELLCSFVLFGQEWRVPLSEISFPITTGGDDPSALGGDDLNAPGEDDFGERAISVTHHFALGDQQRSVIPHQLQVKLNLTSGVHQAWLQLNARAGVLARPALDTFIQFPLVSPDAPVTLEEATLFGNLRIETDSGHALQYAPNALQLVWASCTAVDNEEAAAHGEEIDFLPGMTLDTTTCSGFMALIFEAELAPGVTGASTHVAAQVPTLRLTSGFVEALLACRWGEFLQVQPAAMQLVEQNGECYAVAGPRQAFGASAGDLFIGYTTQWIEKEAEVERDLDGGSWDESFLLNGFLEVTNLISWPANAVVDNEQQRLILPAIGDDAALTHLRHTIRILLNQQLLPSTVLRLSPNRDGTPALFVLAPGHTWQFLAVVEHQLVKGFLQVQSTDSDDAGPTLPSLFYRTDRRWTTLQEVRLLLPATYADFLADDGSQVIDPVAGIAPRWSLYGHYQKSWAELLIDPASADSLHRLPADTILVEASAPHWLRTQSVEILLREGENTAAEDEAADITLSGTTLQFLPSGSQTGILSSSADYAPSAPDSPEWQLITMPFLGRIRGDELDLGGAKPNGRGPQVATDQVAPAVGHSLGVDPILHLWYVQQDETRHRSPLLLMLTSWAADEEETLPFSVLDHAISRTWSRLDPLSLEENWFRLQHPLPEPLVRRVLSIMAALPDTPARLSRATALRQAFRAFRPYYPPQLVAAADANNELAGSLTGPHLIWREESILVWQSGKANSYPWLPVGLQLLTSPLCIAPALITNKVTVDHHVAATLLPAQLQVGATPNPAPVSFAVSPYLGLAQRPAPVETELLVGSVELLCLDAATRQLRPIASQLREEQSQADLTTWAETWAQETRRRLRPDSLLGVVRLRLLFKQASGNAEEAGMEGDQPVTNPMTAPLVVRYSFTLANQALDTAYLTQRTVALRSSIVELRFREGQYGGGMMPEAVKVYELAAPLVTGVQPVYLAPQNGQSVNGESLQWPWGISALTVGVQYTGGKAGAPGQAKIGVTGRAPASTMPGAAVSISRGDENGATSPVAAPPYTLWWHAAQQQVQFRSAISDHGPAAGLPSRFRAQAIKSLLPTLPVLPLPTASALSTDDAEESLTQWQPILPGALRYLLLGARPGAMLVIRNQLLRQRGLTFADGDAGDNRPSPIDDRLISGSVPVQHRVPRPVPLPENRKSHEATALQTWASYTTPDQTVFASTQPADEAFFAPCQEDEMRRVRLQLVAPLKAEITTEWDGEVQFELFNEKNLFAPDDWELQLEVGDGLVMIPVVDAVTKNNDTVSWKLAGATLERVRALLGRKAPGDIIVLQVHAKPADAASDFRQTLSFPLRIRNEQQLRLPLEPRFTLFEDPEYNRRLASLAGRRAKPVQIARNQELSLLTVTLSSDRREYNPDSTIRLRYDLDDVGMQESKDNKAILSLQKVDNNNTPFNLKLPADPQPTTIQTGRYQLFELSLATLAPSDPNDPSGIHPGDSLLIKIELKKAHIKDLVKDDELVLRVDIVAEPVIPKPEAAYALLRRQNIENQPQVECVRFAWGPTADRVDLVCPDDLLQEVVRRRAVFKWHDSVRPQPQVEPQYAVQKIAQNGATHFPVFKE